MYKHILSYNTARQAQSVARRLKALMRIEPSVDPDGEGWHNVSWQTDVALNSTQRGILERTGYPDAAQFNCVVEAVSHD